MTKAQSDCYACEWDLKDHQHTCGSDKTLTANDYLAIAEVIKAARIGSKVRWVQDNQFDSIASGTARSIGDEHANFWTTDQDISEVFLRVTSTMGFEYFIPVLDVVEKYLTGSLSFEEK